MCTTHPRSLASQPGSFLRTNELVCGSTGIAVNWMDIYDAWPKRPSPRTTAPGESVSERVVQPLMASIALLVLYYRLFSSPGKRHCIIPRRL